jgi:demethoxyubiquinone hydroxylase (CLK1/Coq7/Cat5 family)
MMDASIKAILTQNDGNDVFHEDVAISNNDNAVTATSGTMTTTIMMTILTIMTTLTILTMTTPRMKQQ